MEGGGTGLKRETDVGCLGERERKKTRRGRDIFRRVPLLLGRVCFLCCGEEAFDAGRRDICGGHC